jgi:sulfide:quinone oxidoreductase
MSLTKVLILGAGAAGTIIANKLARDLRGEIARDQLEITVLDRDEVNINQGGFTFIPFGLYSSEDIAKKRLSLISPRVNAAVGAEGDVMKVDLDNRQVRVRSGKNYSYDHLVICTGCVPDVEKVPGLTDDFNSFYTSLEDAEKLRSFVNTFEKGHIVVLTVNMPIPCPGAPGKFTVLLDDYLRYVRGVRGNIEITLLWPISAIGPPAYNDIATRLFEDRGVKIHRNYEVSEIDAGKKEVVSSDGDRMGYDFLVTIPPFKVTPALSDSGLTDKKDWMPADKQTLQYSAPGNRHDEVYVIGDTGPAEILKTGIGAHYQALITAENLINDIRKTGVKVPYRGETGCPFVNTMYTPATRGSAHIASWTYDRPLEKFTPSGLGWFLYRSYYYIYWDTAMKALL